MFLSGAALTGEPRQRAGASLTAARPRPSPLLIQALSTKYKVRRSARSIRTTPRPRDSTVCPEKFCKFWKWSRCYPSGACAPGAACHAAAFTSDTPGLGACMHLGGAGRSPDHHCQTHLAACQGCHVRPCLPGPSAPVRIQALSTEYEEDRVDFAIIPQEPPGRRGRLDRHDGHSRAPPPIIGS